MIDNKICNMLQHKDQNGLSVIIDEYGGLLAYIAKNHGITDEKDIEECLSDILFTIWKRFDKFDCSRSSFKTWIVLLGKGCMVDFIRKNKKHRKLISIEQVNEAELKYTIEEDSFKIADMIDLLPPPDDDIFYRKFILGESIKEIAEVLHLTTENIYKRVARGKNRLSHLINKEEV
ncbi:MAG: sigma-70 family RNA polymerase sigma factor [Clostridia bacterium]|nr:sigma-70 family RNA polymerase sigma factor [Clostridia bacterium]